MTSRFATPRSCNRCGGPHPGHCPYAPSWNSGPYQPAQYEDGWFVEYADPKLPLEMCAFIQVKGPFKKEETARKWANKLNSEV